MSREEATGTRTTERALRILTEVGESPDGLSLSDAARAAELATSSTLRQLRTLEHQGFVTLRDDGHYVLGPEFARLALLHQMRDPLRTLVRPALNRLAATTGETAYLGTRIAAATGRYVMDAPGSSAIRHVSWLGQQLSLEGSALGAALDDETGADGCAVRSDAIETGVTAVAAPLVDATGQVVAALSVVGPSFRLRNGLLTGVRDAVATEARSISHLLGG